MAARTHAETVRVGLKLISSQSKYDAICWVPRNKLGRTYLPLELSAVMLRIVAIPSGGSACVGFGNLSDAQEKLEFVCIVGL